jgi:pimeloyl-ACP methyl ester carboxylesterase
MCRPCWSGRGSDVVTREAAEALLQLLPHARYVDVADASHMVAGDRSDVFSAAALEFALPPLLANDG